MSTLPTGYRARAAKIRRLADDLQDPLERARFFDFATEYDKLASYAERRSKNGAPMMTENVNRQAEKSRPA
jgi:hypothetical protein